MKKIAFFLTLFFITITTIAQTETTVPSKTDATTSVKPTVEATSTTVPIVNTKVETKEEPLGDTENSWQKTTVVTPAAETKTATTPATTIAPIVPTVVSIGDGAPIYKIKLKLKNGTSYIGFYSRTDGYLTESFTNDMLAEDIKIKKGTESTIEIVTQYNILELPAIATSVSTNSSVASVALTAIPAKRLVYYEIMNQKKIQKLDIEAATIIEKTVNTTQDVYSDYEGSHRMVVLMKTQPFKCFITINFSDEDCESSTDYILVSYNDNANEFDLRKFAESKKDVFIGNCDGTNNDKEIRQLLEPYNIAFFKEEKE